MIMLHRVILGMLHCQNIQILHKAESMGLEFNFITSKMGACNRRRYEGFLVLLQVYTVKSSIMLIIHAKQIAKFINTLYFIRKKTFEIFLQLELILRTYYNSCFSDPNIKPFFVKKVY